MRTWLRPVGIFLIAAVSLAAAAAPLPAEEAGGPAICAETADFAMNCDGCGEADGTIDCDAGCLAQLNALTSQSSPEPVRRPQVAVADASPEPTGRVRGPDQHPPRPSIR